MGKKKSRGINKAAKAFAALAILVFASCRHAPDATPVPEVMYADMFSPPDTFLDVTELDNSFRPNTSLVDQALIVGSANGFNLHYVGAVEKPECKGTCYVFQEPYLDDVYIVFLVSGARIVAWMSFSQLENGR